MNIFLIDNFDSFTFNLAYEFQLKGCTVEVWRNTLSADEVVKRVARLAKPRLVVMSPGPGTPKEAGCCIDVIKDSKGAFPIFGVCLGHQAIVEAFGGVVSGADMIVHGKTSAINHSRQGIFKDLPQEMPIARYHSLVATQIPSELNATAHSGELIMAVEHKMLPVVGVQFHPESILTTYGSVLIDNVIEWASSRSL